MMKKEVKNHKGFSLLEVVIGIFIFALILQCVLRIFVNTYTGYIRLIQQMNNIDEAYIVEDFIREAVREAAAVEICIVDETLTGVNILSHTMLGQDTCGTLKYIRLYGPTEDIGVIKLRNTTVKDLDKGEYSLVYQGDDTLTQNLISDQIEKIEVAHRADTDYVTFKCTIGRGTSSKETICFTTSIAYKNK